MDFFSYMPNNLFNLFVSNNKNIFAECLIKLFREYEKGNILGMEKGHAQDTIVEILEKNQNFDLKDEEEANLLFGDEEEKEINIREKANYILRRLEKTGWIDIDINYDYQELINFFDYSISIIEAFMEIEKMNGFANYLNDESNSGEDHNQFKGYIYTIYTLLCTNNNTDYAMVLDQVYKNTIAFIRELRKIDSRMKFYLNSLVEQKELKDLMILLINHKEELMSNSYLRLKTSDNVNKYKFNIIQKLEEYQTNGLIMNFIANEYMINNKTSYDISIKKINKQIDEIIDVFKAFEELIHSIDEKNKNYINSTLAKIKFMLNASDDIVGQITKILKFSKKEILENREKTLFDKIGKCFTLNFQKNIFENSFYSQRGNYKHLDTNEFLTNDFDFSSLRNNFFKEFKTDFSEDEILKYIEEVLKQNEKIKASDLIKGTDFDSNEMLRLLFILIYTNLDDRFYTYELTDKIKNTKFDMNDFVITRRE